MLNLIQDVNTKHTLAKMYELQKWDGATEEDRKFVSEKLTQLERFIFSTWDIGLCGQTKRWSGRMEVDYQIYNARNGGLYVDWAMSNRKQIIAKLEEMIEGEAKKCFPEIDSGKVKDLVMRWGAVDKFLSERVHYDDPRIHQAIVSAGIPYRYKRVNDCAKGLLDDILATLKLEEAWALEYKLGKLKAEYSVFHGYVNDFTESNTVHDQLSALGGMLECAGMRVPAIIEGIDPSVVIDSKTIKIGLENAK